MEDLNLIRKIAWKFYEKTNIEYDELFSEASLAYCEALQTFNDEIEGKFSTHASACIRNRLLMMSKFYTWVNPTTGRVVHKPLPNLIHDSDVLDYMEVVRSRSIEELYSEINQWPTDCQTVAKMLLDRAEYFTAESPSFKRKYQATPKKTRTRIKRHLKKTGWSDDQITNVFQLLAMRIAEL